MTEMNLLTNRNRLTESRHVTARGRGGGETDWELGVSKCKLLHLEWLATRS